MKTINNKIVQLVCIIVFAIILSVAGYLYNFEFYYNNNEILRLKNENDSNENNLKIHYVDVSQGDSIIVEKNNHYMLIDAGTNEYEKDLIKYIDNLGITKFDYIIGTHAHEDHIGSMDAVINKYDVDKVLFSKHTTNTKTFEDFVLAVKNKGLKLYAPGVGEEFSFQDTNFKVLAPNSTTYKDLNNYSIVLKLTYKDRSFLFTGDAESLSEFEMLNKNMDLSADVLKIGHHGSSSSTSKKFLDAVNPKYAVILLGKNNDYNHPKQSIMNRLKNKNVKVYRTDEQGSIVATCDGNSISFNVEPGSYDGR